ncbi:MAG: MaoC/PaaZ C-terminal domain-containing protein [SAR324 cluster bacterium]|nr:MaoC/PaaZ C-terminal domain-containing protein [SAR324 cluster bacterium]
MPIDPKQALGALISQDTNSWGPDQVILYHLGLGAGVPPMDENELAYTYEKGLKVLPSFGVIASYISGNNLQKVPGISYNPALLLHGEQDLEIHGPIPTAGTVTNTAHVKDIFDKGKAALVWRETVSKDAAGKLLFTSRSAAFIRGEGGFGGEPGPKPGNLPPERAPDHVVESTVMPQQALIYRLSGDKNPLHAEPAFAKEGGFDQPILHGLCTYGMACKAVVDHALGGDTTRVARYQVRFSGVVFPGETLVTSMWEEGNQILITASVKERESPALTNAAITLRN